MVSKKKNNVFIKIIRFFKSSNVDCVACIYGTSTGNTICQKCIDGNLFIHKEEYEEEN